ncbi:MAG: DUF58 domain-containing protein [Thermoprotei archaeon]
MRITIAGYVHAVSSILLLVYGIAIRNSLVLGIALSLLLIYGYELTVFMIVNKYADKLRVYRSFDKGVYTEMENAEITLTVENTGSIAFPRVTVVDVLPKYITSKYKSVFNISIQPLSTVSITYQARILAPGAHDFEKTVLAISDPLNYFYETHEFRASKRLVALPLSIPSGIGLSSLQRIIGLYVSGKALSGLYDLASFREYTPGDDPRKIVWKAYAKTGKLLVREDYGEARIRILFLIDMRKDLWLIGREPNTLAHLQLRLARSLIEYLLRVGSHIDIAICSGEVPKIRENVEEDPINQLYETFAVLDAGSGCYAPLSIFTMIPNYTGRTMYEYDAVILVTNPITLAIEGAQPLEELVKTFAEKLVVIMPRYNYEELLGKYSYRELLAKISKIVESGGKGLEIVSESLEYSGG